MELTPEPAINRPKKVRRAFWGCLLPVVLGGIVLIFVVTPILNYPRMSTRIMTASINARSIHKALMMYAADHEGRVPEGVTNSNEGFRKLFPDYLQQETLFFVAGSAWHDAAPGGKPDNDIGTPPAFEKTLQPGENHWAYVTGLGTQSNVDPPLFADGFVEGAPGTYTDDLFKKGGVWKGTKAIVVLVSGSAKPYSLSQKTGFHVLRTDPAIGAQVDMFQLPDPPPGAARALILNPE
jgi:hypothetical protein